MLTLLRVLAYPLLVLFILPTALGAGAIGLLVWLFDSEDFRRYDGKNLFFYPLQFLAEKFPLRAQK